MDLRVVNDSQFPYTLHHFTGSKEHHIALRRRALSMNMTINDYGLFKGKEPHLDELSHVRMRLISMQRWVWIISNLNCAKTWERSRPRHSDTLPILVQESDLRGVLHAHSTWSDGQNTIREMAEACIAHGFPYLGISDHSKAAAYANGLSEERLRTTGRRDRPLKRRVCWSPAHP